MAISDNHQHRYDITTCPHCGADLTQPEAVEVHLSTGAHECDDYSQLDQQGILQELPGHEIGLGLHAGSTCSICGTSLDDREIT